MDKPKQRRKDKVKSKSEETKETIKPVTAKAQDESASRNDFEEIKEECEESIQQDKPSEFLKGILNPYKKIVDCLIRRGIIQERTPFCKHDVKS